MQLPKAVKIEWEPRKYKASEDPIADKLAELRIEVEKRKKQRLFEEQNRFNGSKGIGRKNSMTQQ